MNDLNWCINYLKKYNNLNKGLLLTNEDALRYLMNITMPFHLADEYYLKQDNVLQTLLKSKKIINADDLFNNGKSIVLYQGDITLIKGDAIVNAGNEKLLGCFMPLHSCIDNAIHSYAGLQVRRDLMDIMNRQGSDELCGQVKVTKGYNLPSTYIFHTVGPQVVNKVSKKQSDELTSCYLSCLKKADEMHLKTIIFCCISTGVYGFPKEKACAIALKTTMNYLKENNSNLHVVFDLFSTEDFLLYQGELAKYDY
jgi:O-acetyl-ADP-ribose deacetylase (regulator of RNase III)